MGSSGPWTVPTWPFWRFHVPRILNRSIRPCGKRVKLKSQNLAKISLRRLYLVVPFPEWLLLLLLLFFAFAPSNSLPPIYYAVPCGFPWLRPLSPSFTASQSTDREKTLPPPKIRARWREKTHTDGSNVVKASIDWRSDFLGTTRRASGRGILGSALRSTLVSSEGAPASTDTPPGFRAFGPKRNGTNTSRPRTLVD